MKRIEAIIRPDKVSDVCTALDSVGHPGMTISIISGQGNKQGWTQQVRAISYKVTQHAKARLEVVTTDEDVDLLIKTIRNAASTGNAGDGMIFVHDVADAIRIRTNESGVTAL
jgi:nitrogen regulatory protein P-II 1